MFRSLFLGVLALAVCASAACSFSIGQQFEYDKATPLITASNALNTDASKLLGDALAKYNVIYDAAQKADDPFEELGAKADDLKKLEPSIESGKAKLKEASQKLDEASKLKLPDWFKQYLTNLSEINKSGSEHADLILQMVKNTYDPSIQSPEDLDAKQAVVNDKMVVGNKKRDELQAANKKIQEEHKDELK